MRKHPRRAEVDPTHPRGWATSDRNGHIGNLKNMKWQFEWRGASIVNTRVLVHEDELDIPQRQLGTLVIPPDPLPLINARPENYDIDEQPISTRYTLGPDGLAQSIRILMNPNDQPITNRIASGQGVPLPFNTGAEAVELVGGAPIIFSISPPSGPSGVLVTIVGQHFSGVTAVLFDGVSASFTIVNDNQITATVPVS